MEENYEKTNIIEREKKEKRRRERESKYGHTNY